MTRRYVLALDLVDDAQRIAEYDEHHRHVWPAIEQSFQDAGIDRIELYRTGNRLMMVFDVSPAFSFQAKSAADAASSIVQAWERLMETYQRALPWSKPGEKWVVMDRIYEWPPSRSADEGARPALK